MHLHLSGRTMIHAPAQQVWHVLAHEFSSIGHWASAIPTSHGVSNLPVPAGAEVGGRVCATAVPGFTDIQETFTSYDESSMHFAYQATEGRPWFLKRAENHWFVHALGRLSLPSPNGFQPSQDLAFRAKVSQVVQTLLVALHGIGQATLVPRPAGEDFSLVALQ